jgi:hypothetical protein
VISAPGGSGTSARSQTSLPWARDDARGDRHRPAAVFVAGLPDQLGRGHAEIVLDHVGQLDPLHRGHVELVGGRVQLDAGRLIDLELELVGRGLDDLGVLRVLELEPVAGRGGHREAAAQGRVGPGGRVGIGRRIDQRDRDRRAAIGGLEQQLAPGRRGQRGRGDRDLGAGQGAEVAGGRRQDLRRAAGVGRVDQRELEIADQRHRRQRGAIERPARRGDQVPPAIGDQRGRGREHRPVHRRDPGQGPQRLADRRGRDQRGRLDARDPGRGRADQRGHQVRRRRARRGDAGARQLDRRQQIRLERADPLAHVAGHPLIGLPAPARRDRAEHDRRGHHDREAQAGGREDRDRGRARSDEQPRAHRRDQREARARDQRPHGPPRAFPSVDERADPSEKAADGIVAGHGQRGVRDAKIIARRTRSDMRDPVGDPTSVI